MVGASTPALSFGDVQYVTMFNQPPAVEYDWCHRVQRNVQECSCLQSANRRLGRQFGSNFNKIFYGATAFSQLLTNWQVTDTYKRSRRNVL